MSEAEERAELLQHEKAVQRDDSQLEPQAEEVEGSQLGWLLRVAQDREDEGSQSVGEGLR